MIDIATQKNWWRRSGPPRAPHIPRTQLILRVSHLPNGFDVPNMFDGCTMFPTHAPPPACIYDRYISSPHDSRLRYGRLVAAGLADNG